MLILSTSPYASLQQEGAVSVVFSQSHRSHELTIPSSFRKNPHHTAVSITTVPQHPKFI